MNTSGIKCIAICVTVVGSHIDIHLFVVSKGTVLISLLALSII